MAQCAVVLMSSRFERLHSCLHMLALLSKWWQAATIKQDILLYNCIPLLMLTPYAGDMRLHKGGISMSLRGGMLAAYSELKLLIHYSLYN